MGSISWAKCGAPTCVGSSECGKWKTQTDCNVSTPDQSCVWNVPDGCESVDISNECKDGIDGVAVVFGENGDALTKGIQYVALYGPNTTDNKSSYPSSEPCYVFNEKEEIKTKLGKNAYA